MQLNLLGTALQPCSTHPLTGFMRNGLCHALAEDPAKHTVCAVMTDAFLDFAMSRDNDLRTPKPEFGFSGLKPGDRWCLGAFRWIEAMQWGAAPTIMFEATHESLLKWVTIEELRIYRHSDVQSIGHRTGYFNFGNL